MKIKTIILYISSLLIFLYSLSATASINAFARMDHLTEAIVHTYSAIHAPDGETIVQHANLARIHAKATKNDIGQEVDHELLDYGINSLNVVVKEVIAGSIEAAREAAHIALVFITQSAI